MITPCAVVLLSVLAAPAESHDKQNYLYRDLRTKGVPVSSKIEAPLPAPFMPDGLDAKAQQAIVKKLAGDDYPVEELTRRSIVAPHVYKFRDVKPSDPEAPAYGVDLWFIAYGDLDRLAKRDVHDFFSAGRQEAKTHILTAAELAQRNIKLGTLPDLQERLTHVVLPLFKKVQLRGTHLSVVSRTPESLLIAQNLDTRFLKDAQFPNVWQSFQEDDQGKVKLVGGPQPFDGSGSYIKITRLAEPAGALFVEYHQVSIEPRKWFNAANMLRSKLPLAIQSEVRAFRRELEKGK